MKEKQNYKVLHEKFNFMYALNVNHDFIPRFGYVMYNVYTWDDDLQHVTVICGCLGFNQFAYFGIF